MLTPNVGHGHAVAGCGNASASAARASVPSAPPAKIAAISRRSTLGMLNGPNTRGRSHQPRLGGSGAIAPRQGII